ncbi:MAG TPA: hypothetical protein VHO92_01400 [Methanobacterium sp.]|nr:hypothetical protein [Methanobacterium sp.]
MGNRNMPGSIRDALNPYHWDENAAVALALSKRPPVGDPVPDWIKNQLDEKDLAQIAAAHLEKQVALEKQATALKEQLLNHHIEQEKAATAVKEHALTLMKQKL